VEDSSAVIFCQIQDSIGHQYSTDTPKVKNIQALVDPEGADFKGWIHKITFIFSTSV